MGYITVKNDEYDLLKENDYEVVIEEMKVVTLPSGIELLKIKYRVRDDVEQEYKGRCVFEDIWKDKEQPECFNITRISKLCRACGFAVGHEFKDLDDLINQLKGSYLIIHVTIKHDNYRDTDINSIPYYKESKNKPQTVGEKKEEVKDDPELPF